MAPELAPPCEAILPVRAEGLVFEAGGKRLVDGIDLTLTPGTRTVVMGPNGAGKSLLLRLLHGLIEPTAGTVRWAGALTPGRLRRHQAMVFQHPVVLRRSVAANVRYALAVHGVPRAERLSRLHAAFEAAHLTKDLHARHTPMRLPMMTSLGITMLAARAYGLSILDGVYLDLKDDEGYRASCLQGVELGFDGKTLIHPNQIEGANDVFAPSEGEIAWSRKIIEAFAAAEAEGKGVVLVDGKLIENLHVENAKRIVGMADAIAARG